MSSIIVIGSGFAGLSAASHLARKGFKVTVLEKNESPGGRCGLLLKDGFRFDMGPSWYWMPEVFEKYFSHFGKKPSDYYQLDRLDPSYSVFWKDAPKSDIPADFRSLQAWFESIEHGAGKQLERFLEEAEFKYRTGMGRLVYMPGQSLRELLDKDLLKGLLRLDVFTPMSKHVRRFFRDPRLVQLLEFPVLFLGASPQKTPALYSLMNYADIRLGTWYPQGGMYEIVKGMHALAESLGVNFRFGEAVTSIHVKDGNAGSVETVRSTYTADAVISAADYHHTETRLLKPEWRSYSDKYWEKRVMAPSCLLFFVGVKRRIPGLQHHNLFFDADFGVHAKEIYDNPKWPADPLFYVSAPSVTDPTVAPEGMENLFMLIPVAPGLKSDSVLREQYFNRMLDRMEQQLGVRFRDDIIVKESFAHEEFISRYHSFGGNAYGLANTLMQTANLKPSLHSRRVRNLWYAGQLTVPGPGVPPALISGEVAAAELERHYLNQKRKTFAYAAF